MVCNGGPGGGNKDKDGFSIFDHPYWLAGIGVFVLLAVIVAYYMFRNNEKDDEEGHEYQMSD